jgi:hypothetical protein
MVRKLVKPATRRVFASCLASCFLRPAVAARQPITGAPPGGRLAGSTHNAHRHGCAPGQPSDALAPLKCRLLLFGLIF